jgi:hypothetical protein
MIELTYNWRVDRTWQSRAQLLPVDQRHGF